MNDTKSEKYLQANQRTTCACSTCDSCSDRLRHQFTTTTLCSRSSPTLSTTIRMVSESSVSLFLAPDRDTCLLPVLCEKLERYRGDAVFGHATGEPAGSTGEVGGMQPIYWLLIAVFVLVIIVIAVGLVYRFLIKPNT